MTHILPKSNTLKITVLVAVLFGFVTIVAGSGVLIGINPGYKVFTPLLVFNTVMGFLYVLAGLLALKNILLASRIALLIVTLNVCVLAVIVYLFSAGHSVALQSVGAMGFRSLLWLALFIALRMVVRDDNSIKG